MLSGYFCLALVYKYYLDHRPLLISPIRLARVCAFVFKFRLAGSPSFVASHGAGNGRGRGTTFEAKAAAISHWRARLRRERILAHLLTEKAISRFFSPCKSIAAINSNSHKVHKIRYSRGDDQRSLTFSPCYQYFASTFQVIKQKKYQ